MTTNSETPANTTSNTVHIYEFDQDCFAVDNEKNSLIINNIGNKGCYSIIFDYLKQHYFNEIEEVISIDFSSGSTKEVYLDTLISWTTSLAKDKECSLELANNIKIPPTIYQFCDKWNINDYLFIALEIAKKHFPQYIDLKISIEKE